MRGKFGFVKKHRFAFGSIVLVLGMIFVLMGCGHDDDDDSNPTPTPSLSGVFIDSAVSGLSYETTTLEGTTDAAGTFSYQAGETVTFSIGELVLGSAAGAQLLTPLSLVADAAGATDQRVTNRLVLLQILDQDGDLNNGIRITAEIAAIVSAHAASINFDQGTSATQFPASLDDLLAALNAAGVFTDTHRGDRRFLPYTDPTKIATTAQAHFARSIGARNVVETTYGTLSGFETHNDYWQYLGIRYGRPPIGDLRWQPPQAPQTWTGVRDAIAYGDQAPQAEAYAIYNEGNLSEDCLVLNVTAPKEGSGLPVMVWFHGGAFGILSGNALSYNNPLSLPAKGVILVTVNHRLGPFGYMAHPELTAEASGYNGSGNYGQMDLIQALAWVRANIAAFGGNPDNVTIFGQSGGGGKALSLMASPLAAGLFHKVICESGMAEAENTVLNQTTLLEAEDKGTDLSTRLGGLSIAQMRELPFADILNADLLAFEALAWLRYAPNIDGHYLTDTMDNLITAGLANDVPLLAGANAADIVAGADLAPGVAEQMPLRAANNTADQFIYHWSYVPPGWEEQGAGAYHGLELVYVFNYPASFVSHHLLGLNGLTNESIGVTTTTPPVFYYQILGSTGYYDPFPTTSAVSLALTDDVMSIWTNFAKNGDPSVQGVIEWPVYTTETDMYVEIRSDEADGYVIEALPGIAAAFNPIF